MMDYGPHTLHLMQEELLNIQNKILASENFHFMLVQHIFVPYATSSEKF